MAVTVSMEAQRLTASAASVESLEVQALLVVLSVTAVGHIGRALLQR